MRKTKYLSYAALLQATMVLSVLLEVHSPGYTFTLFGSELGVGLQIYQDEKAATSDSLSSHSLLQTLQLYPKSYGKPDLPINIRKIHNSARSSKTNASDVSTVDVADIKRHNATSPSETATVLFVELDGSTTPNDQDSYDYENKLMDTTQSEKIMTKTSSQTICPTCGKLSTTVYKPI